MPVDPTPNLAAFAAGDVPTATQLDTWHDVLDAVSGTWTSYTPALTNITLGNGTLVGDYTQIGKLVHFKLSLTFGSTTAFTGAVAFGLPVTAADANWTCSVFLSHTTASSRQGGGGLASTTTVQPYGTNTLGVVDATHPFTWTTGFALKMSGTYEAA